jgi:hypothetical protein
MVLQCNPEVLDKLKDKIGSYHISLSVGKFISPGPFYFLVIYWCWFESPPQENSFEAKKLVQ